MRGQKDRGRREREGGGRRSGKEKEEWVKRRGRRKERKRGRKRVEERKEKEKVVRWSGRCEKEEKVVREDKQEIEMGERKKKQQKNE